MLHIRNLNYSIGDRSLLKGINWMIRPSKRAALIGPNGAGKTTLLRILNGELQPETGEIIKPREYVIGYLPQEEIAVGQGTILQVALQGRDEIIELENKILNLRHSLENNTGNHDILLK